MTDFTQDPKNTFEARDLLHEAIKQVSGREPTKNELLWAMAQGHLESSWGRGWKGCMSGSHNWGAVQGTPGCKHLDHDAHGNPYYTNYKHYPTSLEGAKDMLRHSLFYKPPANPSGFSRRKAMFSSYTRDMVRQGKFRAASYSLRHIPYFEAHPEYYLKAIRLRAIPYAKKLDWPEPDFENTGGFTPWSQNQRTPRYGAQLPEALLNGPRASKSNGPSKEGIVLGIVGTGMLSMGALLLLRRP